jgi:hypothetical protein
MTRVVRGERGGGGKELMTMLYTEVALLSKIKTCRISVGFNQRKTAGVNE